ncbi:hypothetical protein [Pigmentiphaga humi]|nr:hypothetical protein [Pigmentiphaga humi]
MILILCVAIATPFGMAWLAANDLLVGVTDFPPPRALFGILRLA